MKPAREQDKPNFPITMMDAREMAAHPGNFRRHPLSQVTEINRSLTEFGWLQNVIYNTRTGYILDGHARIAEAAKRGEQVPVRVVNVSAKVERRILLAINKTGEGRVLDEEALLGLFEETMEEGDELPPGWDLNELQELMEHLSTDAEDDEEDAVEAPEIEGPGDAEELPMSPSHAVLVYIDSENWLKWNRMIEAFSMEYSTQTVSETLWVLVSTVYASSLGKEADNG